MKSTFPKKSGETDELGSETPKNRSLLSLISNMSDVDTQFKSDTSKISKPSEFFPQTNEKVNQINFSSIFAKNPLSSREIRIEYLNSKFTNHARNLSLEVLKTDIDAFGEDDSTSIKISPTNPKQMHHRRKSCVCSWCGGASALEKAIQNHPGIPSTLCHTHHWEKGKTLNGTRPQGMVNSRGDRRRAARMNTQLGIPRKSMIGIFRQSTVALDSRPGIPLRRLQKPKISLLDVSPLNITQDFKKPYDLLRLCKTPTRIENQKVEEQAFDSPANLEGSLRLSVRKDVSSGVDERKAPKIIKLKSTSPNNSLTIYNPQFITSAKEQVKPSATQEKPDEDIRRKKVKKNKAQKSFACTIQKIQDAYSHTTSARLDLALQKPQSQTVGRNVTSLVIRKKVTATSSISWGLGSNELFSPTEKARQSEYWQRPEQLQEDVLQKKLAFLKTNKPVEKRKVSSQVDSSLNSIKKMRESYQSLSVVSSPRAKSFAKKGWSPTMSQIDKNRLPVL